MINMIWSAMLGLTASVVPNLIFKRVCFNSGALIPRQIVGSLYLGAALKFVVFVLLFSLLINFPKVSSNTFFWAFLLSELWRWAYGFLQLTRDQQR